MIELLQSLIKIKSLSPKDMGCFDLIEKELSELNFNIKRINYQNVENLYASVGSSGKLFCFLGHTDVVPSGPEEKWKHPPFSATIEDDLLYGRGVADMKGSVAAFIEASKDFLSSCRLCQNWKKRIAWWTFKTIWKTRTHRLSRESNKSNS